jgi:hypothetical protein
MRRIPFASCGRAAVIALVIAIAGVPAPAAQPNIVFIMADDLGWTDLGCFGSRFYETPNIDALASEGPGRRS